MLEVTDSRKCDLDECKIEDDEGKLRCKNCEKEHHYTCTKLPVYQVHLFVKDGQCGNDAYVCEKCADIPPDVKEKLNRQVKTRRDAEVEKLKHDLILIEKELAAERDHVFKLETEQPKNSKKTTAR